ncbi:MAG TPA: heparinase II/III family protein [Alphaproteobacteria bacterium]|nr:heparinase II/III family protein [Alphaproteobacteria bacterium]
MVARDRSSPNRQPSVRRRANPIGAAREALFALWYRCPVHRLLRGGRVPAALHAQVQEPWPGDSAHGRLVVDGRFVWNGHSFHHARAHLRGKTRWAFDWLPDDFPDDGLAALHGFAWLRDLRAVGGDAARAAARARVADWIAALGTWQTPPYRADVTASRIAAWISQYDFLVAGADERFVLDLRHSLAYQARLLARTRLHKAALETRFTILKGLVYADALLFPPGKRLAHVLAQLTAEIAGQIKADGGHVSRSPECQLAVLRDLIDIRGALRAANAEIPEALTQAIDRAAPMVRFFRHGDGGLALFNDTHEGESWLIDVVLTQSEARGKPLGSAPHTGFERVQAGRAVVLLDAGVPEPKAVAHAFAGTLAMEFSVGKERFIVNCGAGAIEEPRWAAALRATAAHSTLNLADANSTEIAFTRLGTRIRQGVRAVLGSRDEADGAVWVEKTHDGYAERFGFLHRRKLYLASAGDDLRGEDALVPDPDGRGARHRRKHRRFAVRFHLHPSVKATPLQDGGVLLRLPSGSGWRFAARGGDVRIEESVYFGGANPRRTSQVVVDGTVNPEGAAVKWAFHRVPERGAESRAAEPDEAPPGADV